MREYKTHTLPQYVQAVFGRPLTLKRLRDGRFEITGMLMKRTFAAESVSDAREAIKRIAQYETKLNDGRITRHRNQGKDTTVQKPQNMSDALQYKPTLNKKQTDLSILIDRINNKTKQPGCLGITLTFDEAIMVRDYLMGLGDAS